MTFIRKILIVALMLVPVLLVAGYSLIIAQRGTGIASLNDISYVLIFYSLGIFLAIGFALFVVCEISKQKKTVGQLRKNEEIAQLLITNVKDYAIFMIDKNGCVASWNAGAEFIKGYNEEEIIGQPIEIFYTADDIEKGIPDRNLRMAKEKGRYEDEGWRLRKDGSKFWADVIFTALRDKYGDLKGFAKVTRDITGEMKLREQLKTYNTELEQRVKARTNELASSEKRFRALIENISDAIVLNDADSNIIYQSPSVKEILGYTPEERKGRKVISYIHPDDRKSFEDLYADLEKFPGATLPFQYRFKHKNGNFIWLEGVVTNLLDDPDIKAYIANYRDITNRKETEEALTKSEELYRSLFQNMLHGFAYCQAIFEKGKVIDYIYNAVNSEYQIQTGLQDVLGRKLSNIMPGLLESDPMYADVLTDVTLTGKPAKFENYVEPLGKWVSVSLYSPAKGYFVTLVDNITERKMAEEKIKKINTELEERVARRTEELKKSNQDMEAFSYSVSHDLRAPLRAIIGFTAILEEDYASKLDKEAMRLTGVIKGNTMKMGNLIDDLLTFSRTGRHQIEKTEINTNRIINEVIQDMEVKNNTGPIEWIIPDLHTINGDINTIRQVWINLISNAIKYSGYNKHPRIEINSCLQGKEIVFSIKDNGVGFDKKYSDKLFKVFQRLHSNDQFEGTGVGLAIVEKIISRHGGKVWAEAEVNEGAIFYFSLPG